jgi:hypothetical protein
MAEESYIQQLASYIKRNLSKGYTLDALKMALEKQDYSRSAIERAIKLANEQLAASAPVMVEKPVIKYEVVEKVEKPKTKKKILKIFK